MNALKFSVLLPTTGHRLRYLKYAVTSVMEQNYDNWELIILDNHSSEDIQSYVLSLKDSRIKYFRTKTLLPVTESWNQALGYSSGDYVIMLGDDDCLLKGYFCTLYDLTKKYDYPDLVYTSAFLYTYPNVFPTCPLGELRVWPNAVFFREKKEPFILDMQERRQWVQETMNFTVMINFNMQFSLVKRSFIDKIKVYGPFYQSPYPDYYATTAMFLLADKVLAVPSPLVVIGICPKSFGAYYFNSKESDGDSQLLKNDVKKNKATKNLKKYVSSSFGTTMNSSWLVAMETIKTNFESQISLHVGYKKYRFLQLLQSFKQFTCRENFPSKKLLSLFKDLFLFEKIFYFLPFFLIGSFIRYNPKRSFGKHFASKMAYVFSHPKHGVAEKISGNYSNILDVFYAQNPAITVSDKEPSEI